MTREKALAFAKMTINTFEYLKIFNPKEFKPEHQDMADTLKAFIETDRKYEALKLTSNISKQEPTE